MTIPQSSASAPNEGKSPERDAERVADAELHALLFPEQSVEWFLTQGLHDNKVLSPLVPRYGADDNWSGMRAVIAAMRERGWLLELAACPGEGNFWEALFHQGTSDEMYAIAVGAPQAVRAAARAALEREAL